MELQPVDNWERLFRAVGDTAFHLEVRDSYAEPSESEPLRRFINGDPPLEYDKSDWTDLIRNVTHKRCVREPGSCRHDPPHRLPAVVALCDR